MIRHEGGNSWPPSCCSTIVRPTTPGTGTTTTAEFETGSHGFCKRLERSRSWPIGRTADGSSPNTITLLEFRTLEEARSVIASEPVKAILQEIRSTGADHPKALLVERSPFTPSRSGLDRRSFARSAPKQQFAGWPTDGDGSE